MNQKIDWYKEVLALEPGSKVFFPLARMQAENGMNDEALATLRHGLGRNPEHIEARLLLIDILFSEEQYDALWPELDQVALMLGGYPGFWSAWNTRLSRNPSSKDASLALSFFSATLRGEAVSWTDVIEQGLRQLLSGEIKDAAFAGPKVAPAEIGELRSYLHETDAGTAGARQAPAVLREAVDPGGASAPSSQADMGKTDGAGVEIAGLDDNDDLLDPLELEDLNPDDSDTDADEEVFSLKTRSMAEILAEQGDYAGALDIYEDLLRHTEDADERHSLQAAVAALSAQAGDAVPASAHDSMTDTEESAAPGQGKNRLMDVLEALAQRLEARS